MVRNRITTVVNNKPCCKDSVSELLVYCVIVPGKWQLTVRTQHGLECGSRRLCQYKASADRSCKSPSPTWRRFRQSTTLESVNFSARPELQIILTATIRFRISSLLVFCSCIKTYVSTLFCIRKGTTEWRSKWQLAPFHITGTMDASFQRIMLPSSLSVIQGYSKWLSGF